MPYMRTVACAGIALIVALQPAGSRPPLSFARAIELPRVEGRIDHLTLDSTGGKLFVAALGNNTVEVLDVNNGTHVRSLPGFREPQGVARIPDLGQIAIASGQGNGVETIDERDFKPIKAIRLGDDADNVRYDAAAKTLYVGYAAGALAAVNPADGRILGRVTLAGHPESFQLERSGPRVFVNVPPAGHIAVVDRRTLTIAATWPVAGAAANYPMALDEANHRLFVGCRRPAKVIVVDTTTGQAAGAYEIVGDTDDLFYDAARQRLYVTGGDGFIDVLEARPSTALTRLARIATAAGARTSLFVPEQNRLYLAVPHRGAQRAEIRVYDAS
jgi:DNA-binding beta-propeller fold protein YncE